jgi:DNA-binding NtrC family response regulator
VSEAVTFAQSVAVDRRFVGAPDVEEMPSAVQDVLDELLSEPPFARAPSAAVRLITGTTVSLFDRIAADRFSERLFYRLNVIHIVVPDGTA